MPSLLRSLIFGSPGRCGMGLHRTIENMMGCIDRHWRRAGGGGVGTREPGEFGLGGGLSTEIRTAKRSLGPDSVLDSKVVGTWRTKRQVVVAARTDDCRTPNQTVYATPHRKRGGRGSAPGGGPGGCSGGTGLRGTPPARRCRPPAAPAGPGMPETGTWERDGVRGGVEKRGRGEFFLGGGKGKKKQTNSL